MVVDVLVKDKKITFNIPRSYGSYGGGSFEGKLSPKGIRGRFTFGDAVGDEEFLVRGRSYWDR